jgi:uncharacterized protein (DUF362 family)
MCHITPMGWKVYIREQAEYDAKKIAPIAGEILQQIGVDLKHKTVLVKPSFVYPSRSPSTRAIITNPQFVVGIARALKGLGARRILIAESSILGPARFSFHAVGILPLIRGLAEPVYLDEEDTVEVKVKNPLVQETFKVPRIWLDADIFLSMPKIKTNLFSGITLTVKNNLGLLRQQERLSYHDYRLHQKLADLFTIRPPELVFADCITAGEGQGPLLASPVNLGLILAGTNALAVDVTACALVGFDSEVEHIKLLAERGFGPASASEVEIMGAEITQRGKIFSKPQICLDNLSPSLRIFRGDDGNCISGCAGMIRGLIDPYLAEGAGGVKPMNVIFGKSVRELPYDLDPRITLVVGDCAEVYKKLGVFIPGCCPRPIDIAIELHRIQGSAKSLDISASDIVSAIKAYTGHYLWRWGKMLAGKHIEPIENHLPAHKMLKALFRELISRFTS